MGAPARKRGLRRSGRGKEAKPRLTETTASEAIGRWGQEPFCACGCGPATQWHHIFDQQHYPALVDELDNIMPVATRCHERHTKALQRYPRRMIGFAERLAINPQMERYLDRCYPVDPL